MAELTIRPDEIRDALAQFVEEYEPPGVEREEVGTVIEAGDGIAQVEGLPSAMANELLEFENGVHGIALNLDVRQIGVVILGEFAGIEEGQRVKRTGAVLSVPVGDSFLGRVVDPLGQPLDGLGEVKGTSLRAREPRCSHEGGAPRLSGWLPGRFIRNASDITRAPSVSTSSWSTGTPATLSP